jgi:Lysyl oxidase
MRHPRWAPRCAAAAAGLALVASLPAGVSLASATGSATGPVVKLIASQKTVTVGRFGGRVFIDPGVYISTSGAPLEFDVQRASYSRPLTITQVIKVPGKGTVLRRLPTRALDGWTGLRRFLRVTLKNSHGKTVGENVMPFCPNSGNPQRATPRSPFDSPFPTGCNSNPFELGMVWGVQRGWAVDPFGGGIIVIGAGSGGGASRGTAASARGGVKLKLGTYTETVTITRLWQRLLHVTSRDATVKVKIKVVKANGCIDICPPRSARHRASHPALPTLPRVPTLTSPPASILPDMVPAPSWGISVQNHPATAKHPVKAFLSFGATVWIGGHSRLDVEGFRSHQSPIMKAYQYFWKNGRVIGRARAGTMGFDNKKGHHHWHFQQFAEYRLLSTSKSVVVRSQKVGFCIAPTDAMDLLIPHAVWQPSFTGLEGACGSPSALWVQEMLPLGWGDTYFQSIAGQSFDISKLPNGTYYIEIIANPERVLHESDYANDASLRKVIIGGTPGHRTVRVPALHGIDPEG